MSRRTCHRCECARVSLAGNSRRGKSSGQSGLVGLDSTRSGRPEPMAWHNSDSQASGGRKKSKQDFSRPHDLLSQYRGRKIGPVLCPLHSLTDYREPLAFQRLVQRAAKNIGMPFRTSRTFILRGAQQTPEDADIPNDMGVSASRCSGQPKPLQHPRFRRRRKRPENSSISRPPAGPRKGVLLGLPCTQPWRLRTPLTYTTTYTTDCHSIWRRSCGEPAPLCWLF
jgi:hypothetical protein